MVDGKESNLEKIAFSFGFHAVIGVTRFSSMNFIG